MSLSNKHSVLIVEPNKKLNVPYRYLSTQLFNTKSTPTIQLALSALSDSKPKLVFLSTSFSPQLQLQFLEALKNASTTELIPLILVIDLSRQLSTIPGTSWGGKVGLLHNHISKSELSAVLRRIM